MVDLSKFSVKELSNEGVDFYLIDDSGLLVDAGEQIPIKFVLYGVDSKRIIKARTEYSAVVDAKNVKPHKKEEAVLKFIASCVRSWDSFKFHDKEIKDGDTEALIEFFEECPQFGEQITSFVTNRENFLAK
jgi:hypothetical protein